MKFYKSLFFIFIVLSFFISCAHEDSELKKEVDVKKSLFLNIENEELTNQNVKVILSSDSQIIQASFYEGVYNGSGQEIINSSLSKQIENNDGQWSFLVFENGLYSVGAKTSDGSYLKAVLTVKNIDKKAPLQVSHLALNYTGSALELSWKNPESAGMYDSPLFKIKLCWAKNDENYSEEILLDAGSEKYSISSIEGSESDFIKVKLKTIDELGNEGLEKEAVRYLKTYSDLEKTAGNIITSSGTFTPSEYKNLSKTDALAVVAFVNESGIPVALGLSDFDKKYLWCSKESSFYTNFMTENICTPSVSSASFLTSDASSVVYNSRTYLSAAFSDLSFSGDCDGSDNLAYIKSMEENLSLENYSSYYPAFYFIENYSSGTFFDGWYMPSIYELCKIAENLEKINEGLKACNTCEIGNNWYWSSSQSEDAEFNVWSLKIISQEKNTCQIISTSAAGSKVISYEYEESESLNQTAGENESFSENVSVNLASGSFLSSSGISETSSFEKAFTEELALTLSTTIEGAVLYYSFEKNLDENNFSTDGIKYNATDDYGNALTISVDSSCRLWAVCVKAGKIAGSCSYVFSKYKRIESYANGCLLPLRVFN